MNHLHLSPFRPFLAKLARRSALSEEECQAILSLPGRPLQVTAFYQSGDRLAEAEYDPRSGRVDVRFAG